MRRHFVTSLATLFVLVACNTEYAEQIAPADLAQPTPPNMSGISQVAPIIPHAQQGKDFLTAGGDENESAKKSGSSQAGLGDVALEPATWDPNAFIRPRRRMNIDQLDQAIRDATGGVGWDDSQNN